jgi:hypothetical protein
MSKGKAQDLFRAKAPGIMALLMRDFPIELDDAAAVLGNLGHECGGFASLQEISPTVVGSAGGYGWAQWTGPRRRSYEAYCKRNRLDPAGDVANYGFLFSELKGPERKAIARVKAAKGLNAKVKAFELAYERAGAKHYSSRNEWAAVAFDAWHAAGGGRIPQWALSDRPAKPPEKPVERQEPVPTPGDASQPPAARPDPVPARRKNLWTTLLGLFGLSGVAAGGAGMMQADSEATAAWLLIGVLVVIAGLAAFLWLRGRK